MKLPRKPSALIKLALNDLSKVERSKKYKVLMSMWHVPTLDDACFVCLAGSVMAKTLKLDSAKEIDKDNFSDSFSESITNKLLAINDMREGNMMTAFTRLRYSRNRGDKFTRNITDYRVDKVLFKKQMRTLARDLEKAGY